MILFFFFCLVSTVMIINRFRLNHFQVQNESLHRTFELIIAFVFSCMSMHVCVFVSVSAQIEAVGPAF